MRAQKGFTITEVVVVIAVIAILAGLVVTAYIGAQQRTRDTERANDVQALESAVNLYAAEESNDGIYPWTSGFMTSEEWAPVWLEDYVDDTSVFYAPGTDIYSVVNHYDSGAGITSIENMQAQIELNEYHYIPLYEGGMCLWANHLECDGFIFNWLDEDGNMHERRG